MSDTRLIRKYVNRRLYDTTESRYVNLDDLRRVINSGGEIKVVDQANGHDITTTVQLQIIGEIEKSGAPLLNADFLASLIRLAGKERDPALGARLHAALRAAVVDNRTARPAFEAETVAR